MSRLLASKYDKKHGAFLIDSFMAKIYFLHLRSWRQYIDGHATLKEMRYKGYR